MKTLCVEWYVSSMTCNYHTTTKDETLDPHVFVDSYKNEEVKEIMHRYKFAKDKTSEEYIEAKSILIRKTTDLCMFACAFREKTCHIFTSPPSTMFERGEKDEDSMFELVRNSVQGIAKLIHMPKHSYICATRVFAVSREHLVKQRAQHIGAGRKARTSNLEYRYTISLRHKFFLWFFMRVCRMKKFSYIIIDDVSSTGATLAACNHTLLAYLKRMQKKNPNIVFDVEIFSLTH